MRDAEGHSEVTLRLRPKLKQKCKDRIQKVSDRKWS